MNELVTNFQSALLSCTSLRVANKLNKFLSKLKKCIARQKFILFGVIYLILTRDVRLRVTMPHYDRL